MISTEHKGRGTEKHAFNSVKKDKKKMQLGLKIGRMVRVGNRKRKRKILPLVLWCALAFFLSFLCDSVMAFSQPLELSSKFFLVQVCTIDPDRC